MTIRPQVGLIDINYKRLYLTSVVPHILWAYQNPQTWHPLRPIVSSRGAVTFGVAKELADIIRPLVHHSLPH